MRDLIILIERAETVTEIMRIPQSDVGTQAINDGIQRARATKRSRLGTIGDVVVTIGQGTRTEFDVLFAENNVALGYAMLTKTTIDDIDGHFVTEIGLRPKLRGRGIGYDFYNLLLDLGYTLFSGTTQTPNGEGVWKKLRADPRVTTEVRNIDRKLDGADTDPWSDMRHVIVARRK